MTRGAAWTAPVVLLSAPVPAFAASPCHCSDFTLPAFPASGQSGNGWAITSTGGTSGGGTDQFDQAGFVTVADPPNGRTRTVSASRSICVQAARTYRFTYAWTAYLDNPRPMTSVLQISGVTVAGSTIDTSTSSTSGTRDVTWMATTTGNVTLAFVHTTSAAGTTVTGDDITIRQLTGSCS